MARTEDGAVEAAELERAFEAGLITAEEREQVLRADRIRDEVIQVDAFNAETFKAMGG